MGPKRISTIRPDSNGLPPQGEMGPAERDIPPPIGGDDRLSIINVARSAPKNRALDKNKYTCYHSVMVGCGAHVVSSPVYRALAVTRALCYNV